MSTEPNGLTVYSDSTATPDEQAKQVLAIYPIVDGQTIANLGTTPTSEATENNQTDDLIDISGGENATAKPSNEIESMLQETGKPAEGSLIDFS